MSKKHESCEREVTCPCQAPVGIFGNKNCCCSLPTLIILILIILQFGKKRRSSSSSSGSGSGKLVDNSLLFIIALFYLSCCNPCKGMGMMY